MRYVAGLLLEFPIQFAFATIVVTCASYFSLARWGFRRACRKLKDLQVERVRRSTGILNPHLKSSRFDPFAHLPPEMKAAELVQAQGLRFENRSAKRIDQEGRSELSTDARAFIDSLTDWEHHHLTSSESFVEALSHLASQRLQPEGIDLNERISPIGGTILQLIGECENTALQRELRHAYSGLITGASQNLAYASRRIKGVAKKVKEEFNHRLGAAHQELQRFRYGLIQSICRDAEREIAMFQSRYQGWKLNPVIWGSETAYRAEMERLRADLTQARDADDLNRVTLIVLMLVEDEERFVEHLRSVSRDQQEIHREISGKLQEATHKIYQEASSASGWVYEENSRLTSTVTRQIVNQMETWLKNNQHQLVNDEGFRIQELINRILKLDEGATAESAA